MTCNQCIEMDHFFDDSNIQKAVIFKALGDPTRLMLFQLIVNHPDICACELLEKLDIAQTTLSHHLKILSQASLIIVRKDGRWKHYSSNQKVLEELVNYMETLKEDKS